MATILAVTILIGVGYQQADQKVGGRAAEHDFPDHRERREAESAARTSAEDKAGGAGDCERGKRFVAYILADIAIAAGAASGSVGGTGPGVFHRTYNSLQPNPQPLTPSLE